MAIEDKDELLNDWAKKVISYENVFKSEKELSKQFEEAVRSGADPKELAGILIEWKDQHTQLREMERQLFDGRTPNKAPDAFQDYVRHSKVNVGKGMSILADKTKGFVEETKDGIIKNGSELTNKIKDTHNKLMAIFHEKQAVLSQKLGKFIDGLKDKIQDYRDNSTLNRWENAVIKAESYRLKSMDNQEDRIQKMADKISSKTQSQLEKNSNKFQSKVENVMNPSTKKRISVGLKTIADAVQGKEYKAYSVDKTTDEATKDLQRAKAQLEKADSRAVGIGKLKLDVVKAWAKMTTSLNKFKANFFEKQANMVSKNFDKVKKPESKEIINQIQKAMDEGMSQLEALKYVHQQNTKKTSEDIGKDVKIPSDNLDR